MKKSISISPLLLAASLLTTALMVNADVLTLKDGQTITGTFISRDANEVIFEIAGQKLKFDSAKVTGISFGEIVNVPSNVNKDQSIAKEKPIKAESEVVTKKITVPVGARMVVRTSTTLNTDKHATGHKFTARLEADMVVGDVVVVPKGSTVYGVVSLAKKSGRLVGKATMELTFTDIMLNNTMVAIKTSGVKVITEAEAKNTVGRTARAAAIGGLIDGSDGAKTGAKVGLGVALLSRGNSINIPVGTLLEFQIAAPFTP